jgi:hypothetical protein
LYGVQWEGAWPPGSAKLESVQGGALCRLSDCPSKRNGSWWIEEEDESVPGCRRDAPTDASKPETGKPVALGLPMDRLKALGIKILGLRSGGGARAGN